MVDALCHVRITAAASWPNHSLALFEDGAIFSWGSNDGGQLGLGRSGGREPLPQRVDALGGITVWSVAAGKRINLVVTAAGELFTWGNRDDGCFGYGDLATQLAPRRVESIQGAWVVAVSAGRAHAIAATGDGSVFGCGKAEALGLP
jgi:E3 ubiquitin-protein ligase HERC2